MNCFDKFVYFSTIYMHEWIPVNWMCVTPPIGHPVLGKGVTNMRTVNLLTYIILNNYLENINLQKYFIYIHHSGIYNVLYIYSESHLLVLLGSYCLQNLTFTLTK